MATLKGKQFRLNRERKNAQAKMHPVHPATVFFRVKKPAIEGRQGDRASASVIRGFLATARFLEPGRA